MLFDCWAITVLESKMSKENKWSLQERIVMKNRIEWNGFLEQAVDNYPEESCAFLYSDKPLENGRWFVFPIKNIAEDKKNCWVPDKKEMQQVKKEAKEKRLIKMGNIHTHLWPLKKAAKAAGYTYSELLEYYLQPSDMDLKFAKRFNDIIRGIIVVSNKAILGMRFHDMFGRKIEIYPYRFFGNGPLKEER